jgi:hypothetical protein
MFCRTCDTHRSSYKQSRRSDAHPARFELHRILRLRYLHEAVDDSIPWIVFLYSSVMKDFPNILDKTEPPVLKVFSA